MSLYAGALAPKEYDAIELSPPAKPTSVKYLKKGAVIRTLTLEYEGENLKKVSVA